MERKRAARTKPLSPAQQRVNRRKSAQRAADTLKIFPGDALACILPYEKQQPPTRSRYLVQWFSEYRRKCLLEFETIGERPFMFWTNSETAAGAFCHVLIINSTEPSCALFLKGNWPYGKAQIYKLKDLPIDIVAEIEACSPNANRSWSRTRPAKKADDKTYLAAIRQSPGKAQDDVYNVFLQMYNQRAEREKRSLELLRERYAAEAVAEK